MRVLWELPLLHAGAITVACIGLALSVVLLVCASRRPRIILTMIAAVVAAVVVFEVIKYLVVDRWELVPGPVMPLSLLSGATAVGIAITALFALRSGVRGKLGWRRWLRALYVPVTIALVFTSASLLINYDYQVYGTVSAVLGRQNYPSISTASVHTLEEVDAGVKGAVARPLERTAPALTDLPDHGRVWTTAVPGTASGFKARPANIYLPPAYLAGPAVNYPVLVLLAGQPGGPDDWFRGGEVTTLLDTFADAHHGIAPITISVDFTGSTWANQLCVDSSVAKVSTYLSEDVPAFLKSNLAVSTQPQDWAIGGLSLGGTCSVQTAVAHPDVYRTFVTISGELAPGTGDHAEDLQTFFGGAQDRYDRANPQWLFAHNDYAQLAGAFVVGREDKAFAPGLAALCDLAKAAHVDAHYTVVPGGHDFGAWRRGLTTEFPWIAQHIGITA